LKEYAKKYVNYCGGNNPKLMTNAVQKIPIPLPPLPIQKAIVDYLDPLFTDYEELFEKLQKNITHRKTEQKRILTEMMSFEK